MVISIGNGLRVALDQKTGSHWIRRAASRAAWTAGSSSEIKMAMIAMITSNSISVKPLERVRVAWLSNTHRRLPNSLMRSTSGFGFVCDIAESSGHGMVSASIL
jgi:hypothetical protein